MSTRKKIFNLIAVVVILILCAANFSAAAADYPTKPITIIVPIAPGGLADTLWRTFGSVAEKLLGQPILIANKPGASGQIGMLACAQAAPDGYTLATPANSSLLALEWEIVNGRKPLTTPSDFANIGTLSRSMFAFTVPYNSPWKSLADLIHDGKANPDKYAFCSNGLYEVTHVCTEIFMKETGLRFRHVPFSGGGPAASALVGNHVDFGVTTLGSTVSLVRGNKLRYLAVLASKRCKAIPDIPTTKELGIDLEFFGWIGLVAPQKTPVPIVKKLGEVIKKVGEDKSFINVLEDIGDEFYYVDSEGMSTLIDSTIVEARKIFLQLK